MAVWPNGSKSEPTTSSQWGYSSDYEGFHYGSDWKNFDLNCAVADGQITKIGWNTYGGGGREIYYRLGNGDVVLYYHNEETALVSVGQWVAEGQPLGRQGATGKGTGKHLHAEVWLGGSRSRRVDPRQYFAALVGSSPAGGGNVIIEEDKETPMAYIIHSIKDDLGTGEWPNGYYVATPNGIVPCFSTTQSVVNRLNGFPDISATKLFSSEVSELDRILRSTVGAVDIPALAKAIAPLIPASAGGAPTAKENAVAVKTELGAIPTAAENGAAARDAIVKS